MKMNETPADISLHLDSDGSIFRPECLLDVHYLNQDYVPKFDASELKLFNGLDARNFQKSSIKDGLLKPLPSIPKNEIHFNPNPLIHPPTKPFRCETCKKTFSQQSNLCKHILIHSGVKPYICDICDKRFTQQANLIKHRRIHTGDKPFECEICRRCFSQKANLNKHLLLHTGEKHFHCEFCDRSFVQQANLERHRRTHTGERPYSCTVCQKRFTQRGNLTKHMLIHCVKSGQIPEQFLPSKQQTHKVRKPEYDPNMAFKFGYNSYQFSVPVLLSAKEAFFWKRF